MNVPNPNNDPERTPVSGDPGPVELVHLNHPQDLLAVIPYVLGYHPAADSLIAVAMTGGRLGVTLCVDATRLGPRDVPALWARLTRPLAETGTQHVALVGYLPASREDLLLAFASASPVQVLDVLRTHEGRWWCLTCPNGPECCPPGQPVTDDPAVVAPLIAATGAPAASRADLAACLHPGPAEVISAVAALLPLDPTPPPDSLYASVAAAHTACGDGPIPLAPDRAALLLEAVADVRIRDASCGWYDDAAWWLWTTLVRCSPVSHVPPVATLIATTAYQRGDAVLARMAAEHALAADPDYAFGQLMLGIVDAQIHPQTIRDGFAHVLAQLADLPAYQQLGLPSRHDTRAEKDHGDGHSAAQEGPAGGGNDG